MVKGRNNIPLRTALTYALFGVLWIFITDEVIEYFFPASLANQIFLQTILGWLFIFMSASLFYLILINNQRSLLKNQPDHVNLAEQTDGVPDALIQNEKHFRALIENGMDNISLLSANGMLLWESPATIRSLGYEQNQFRGKNILKLIHPNDKEWVNLQFVELLKQPRTVRHGIFRIQHANGSWRWMEGSANNLLDEPTIHAIVINYRDVTEKKLAEQAVYFSQQQLLSMIREAPISIAMFDLSMKYLASSQCWVVEYGNGYTDLIGKSYYEVHSDTPELWKEIHQRGLSGETLKNDDDLWVHVGGAQSWVSWVVVPWHNGKGRIEGIIISVENITERKHAAESLKQSEQNYREVLEYASDGIFIVNQQAQYVLANEAACELIGYSQTELLGMNLSELIAPEDLKRHPLRLEELREGKKLLFERIFLHKNGTQIICELSAKMLPDGRFQALVRDISKRKKAEQALNESEERFRALIELTTDAFSLINENSRIIYSSPSVNRVLGYLPHERIGHDANELIHPDDLSSRNEAFLGVLKKPGGSVNYEMRLRHKEGHWLWFASTLTNLLDHPAVRAIVNRSRDITGRKQSEQREQKRIDALELSARGAPLISVLETIIGIAENDSEDVICSILLADESKQHLLHGAAPRLPEFYNQAIHGIKIGMGEGSCGTAAYTKHRVIVQDVETHPYWEKYREFARQAGVRACWSEPILSSSGEVLGTFAIYHTQPFMPGPDELGTIISITSLASIAIERERTVQTIQEYALSLEQRVEQRTAELVYANHTKDEFLANMSHELRTPLNSVLGFAETLLEGVRGALNERQEQALQIIHSSGEHLLELINDILDVSKIEAGKFDIHLDSVNINDLCQSSLSFVKQLAGRKSITVEFLPAISASTMIGDSKRLKQILVNLLNNAVKFTPEKGRVSLEVLADVGRSEMRFTVTDTGIGIAPEDLLKLFKPFVQLDSSLSREYEGSGLGLMLVQKLTEMHGGFVEVQTEIGKGSSFIIVLPWKQKAETIKDENEQENIPSSNSNALQNAQIKILLAEDNETNVMVVKDYLEAKGYQMFIAHHGREALEIANEISPALILMDIQMPEMDGLEATRRLRTTPKFATVPIIALTAFAMPGDRDRCLEAGANEYLAKPINLKKLLDMINKFIN